VGVEVRVVNDVAAKAKGGANARGGSALLVMDVQLAIVERYRASEEFIRNVAEAAAGARSAGVPVVYIVLLFRDGHPEISPRNLTFAQLKRTGSFTTADPGAEIHHDVAPKSSDVIVHKKRVSAFAGSDLEVVLRSLAVEEVVLAGLITSGVVLSTFLQATDLDFRAVVLGDATTDPDLDLHAALTERLLPSRGEVVSVHRWIESLGQ